VSWVLPPLLLRCAAWVRLCRRWRQSTSVLIQALAILLITGIGAYSTVQIALLLKAAREKRNGILL
jgi:hypothetical protein